MLNQLIEESKAYDQHKWDVGPYRVDGYRFAPNGNLRVGPSLFSDAADKPMTDHAFRQACGKLGPACWGTSRALPAEYLMKCPPAMRAQQMNYWIDQTDPERQWFVRGYQEEVRAILSDRYAVIDVTETLEWAKDALDSNNEGIGFRFVRPVVTPDVLHLRILYNDIDTGPGGHYGIGGYLSTGEIGNRRIGVYPLIQRHACDNSIVIPSGQFMWEHTHVGRRLLLKQMFQTAIFEVLDGAISALEALLESDKVEIANFTKHVQKLAEARGWSADFADQVVFGSEGHSTVFGLVNGISYAAHSVEDPDEQAGVQSLAGEFLATMMKERVPAAR